MPKKARRVFLENPYDIETILESITIASRSGKEIIFLDRLITGMRKTPDSDMTKLSYDILSDLQLIQL